MLETFMTKRIRDLNGFQKPRLTVKRFYCLSMAWFRFKVDAQLHTQAAFENNSMRHAYGFLFLIASI